MHINKVEIFKNQKQASSANSDNDSNNDNVLDINLIEENCLKKIYKWLEENPHINARKEQSSLLYFVRGCKCDVIRVKKKIESFYLMKAERIEWFSNRNPFLPEIQELLKIGVFLPLLNKDNEGRLVVIIRTGAHDPKTHSQNNVLKTGKMILDLILHKDETISSTGVVAIFDMTGVQLGHGLQMTPTIIKRSVESWQIYPCKLKLLEFINAPIHINVILNTFRFFMSSKMKSRIIVRNTTSKLVNATYLPKDLGGKGQSFNELAKYWKHFVEENADFYEDDEQYKTVLNSTK